MHGDGGEQKAVGVKKDAGADGTGAEVVGENVYEVPRGDDDEGGDGVHEPQERLNGLRIAGPLDIKRGAGPRHRDEGMDGEPAVRRAIRRAEKCHQPEGGGGADGGNERIGVERHTESPISLGRWPFPTSPPGRGRPALRDGTLLT